MRFSALRYTKAARYAGARHNHLRAGDGAEPAGSPNDGGYMRNLFVAVLLAGTLASIGVANAADGCGPGKMGL
jgi:hypothetical protein